MASGECVVKINEVILEAVDANTGTPNGDPKPTGISKLAQDFETGELGQDLAQAPAAIGNAAGNTINKLGGNALGKTQLGKDWKDGNLGKDIGKGISALGRGIKGAWQGVQKSQAQRAATAAGGTNLQAELGAWKQFATQRAPVVNMKDPATLQQQLQAWADSRYPSSKGQVDVSKVRAGNQTDIQNYITNRYNTAMANRTAGAGAKTQNTGNVANDILNQLVARAEQAGDRIGADDVTKELSTLQMSPMDRRELTKQILEKLKGYGIDVASSPYGANPGEAPTLSPGVRIISSDPVVLGYDKRKYALNRQNQWVTFGTSKLASPEMAKFLNKQAQAM